MKRLLTVTILVSLGIPFVLVAPPRVFGFLVALISFLCYREYLHLIPDGFTFKAVYSAWGLCLAAIVSLSVVLSDGTPASLIYSFSGAVLGLFLVDLVIRRSSPPELILTPSLVITGLSYCVLPLSYATLIRFLPDGRNAIIELSLITLLRDLASNISGRLLGTGDAVAPAVSPRKTMQGSIGGWLLTMAFMFGVHQFFPQFLLSLTSVSLGLLVTLLSIGGQIGDLVESLLKRVAQVKDSSGLFPGQGGMLDSFDSFVFTAPLMYFYLSIFVAKSAA